MRDCYGLWMRYKLMRGVRLAGIGALGGAMVLGASIAAYRPAPVTTSRLQLTKASAVAVVHHYPLSRANEMLYCGFSLGHGCFSIENGVTYVVGDVPLS